MTERTTSTTALGLEGFDQDTGRHMPTCAELDGVLDHVFRNMPCDLDARDPKWAPLIAGYLAAYATLRASSNVIVEVSDSQPSVFPGVRRNG